MVRKARMTDADYWRACLTRAPRQYILQWLRENPPPPTWKASEIAYAYTEMLLPLPPLGRDGSTIERDYEA